MDLAITHYNIWGEVGRDADTIKRSIAKAQARVSLDAFSPPPFAALTVTAMSIHLEESTVEVFVSQKFDESLGADGWAQFVAAGGIQTTDPLFHLSLDVNCLDSSARKDYYASITSVVETIVSGAPTHKKEEADQYRRSIHTQLGLEIMRRFEESGLTLTNEAYAEKACRSIATHLIRKDPLRKGYPETNYPGAIS